MAKKGKSFNVGDYVFAKVKGYPPWPAKVSLFSYANSLCSFVNQKYENYLRYCGIHATEFIIVV